MQRQNSNPGAPRLDRDDCSIDEGNLVVPQNRNNRPRLGPRRYIGRAELNHRRLSLPRLTVQNPEIQIVRKDNLASFPRSLENLQVVRVTRANLRPMGSRNPLIFQGRHPLWREVHIDQKLQAGSRGTSTSSTRHVA